MYKILTACLAFLSAFMLLALRSARMGNAGRAAAAQERLRAGEGFECTPSAGMADIQPDAEGRFAPVFPGWGHYHYPVSTKNDSAQFFFDQGLSLYYGFQTRESFASFKEAARRDSNCAILYWGQIMALGPFYNDSYYFTATPEMRALVTRMNQFTATATPKERDLVGALTLRFDADTADRHRVQLNHAYSERMRELIGRYPGDPDIKALYIDGMMTEHAWDMWDDKGNAKPWTPELIKDCAEILAVDSLHPAALHYQIHLVEASMHPEAALRSANLLPVLMPGVAHMVHMSSHTYQRVGNYKAGVISNDRANVSQGVYDSIARGLHLGNAVYHYYAVQTICAMNGGMQDKAMQAANRCKQIINGNSGTLGRNSNYRQFLWSMPLFAGVRLGDWKGILDSEVPDSSAVYACILSDFARGMAYLRTGKMDEAQKCLDQLRGKLDDPRLPIRRLPANPAIEGAKVAEGLLSGEMLFASGKREEAFAAFNKAIEREDRMYYSEPKEWPLPVREYAGQCLLKAGRIKEAAYMYKADLEMNPGNGWAMVGLAQCRKADHKDAWDELKISLGKAFEGGARPPASAY